MVLYNGYINKELQDGKITNPVFFSGEDTKYLIAKFQVNNTYDNGSVLRIANIPSTAIIVGSKVFNSTIAGLSDADLGIYNPISNNLGEALADNIFLDGATFTTARSHATGALDGLSALGTDDVGKRLYEMAGQTSLVNPGSYDIGLKLNSTPTANPVATGQYIIISLFYSQG